MFIVRVQTIEENRPVIRTFTFEAEKDMDYAVHMLKETSCNGFSATVKNAADTRGHIRDKWNHGTRGGCSLYRTVSFGAYKDHVYEVYGLKEECASAADKTNARVTCWADTTAVLKHVAGDLYKVTYISPFTD